MKRIPEETPAQGSNRPLVLVASSMHMPWDDESNQPKAIIILDPSSNDPIGCGWDFLASPLGVQTRNEFRNEHHSMDGEGAFFIETDEVETKTLEFFVWSREEDEEVALYVNFSAYIVQPDEFWCVSVEDSASLSLLQLFLAHRKIEIEILADESIFEDELEEEWTLGFRQLEGDNLALKNQLSAEKIKSNLLEIAEFSKRWGDVPSFPTDLRWWLIHGAFESAEVEILLATLGGKSQSILRSIETENPTCAEKMREGLSAVLGSEYTGVRHTASWPNPDYMRWKTIRKALGDELEWLSSESDPA